MKAAWSCETCGEPFATANSKGAHIRYNPTHGVRKDRIASRRDVRCAECGTRLRYVSMVSHLSGVHGLPVHNAAAARPYILEVDQPPTRVPAVIEATASERPAQTLERVDAATLAALVVDSLFPRGIAADKLPAVLRWYTATEAFLVEVGA
jgi:DNA-directed RNA polymerase subunit RPC12/RpoP